jgi:hypothetical protein
VDPEHRLEAGPVARAGQGVEAPAQPPDPERLDDDEQEQDEGGRGQPDDDRDEVGLDERIEVDRKSSIGRRVSSNRV